MENTTERNWGAEEWRAPSIKDGDTILFSECGRCLGGVDYRSHYFRLVREDWGGIALLVQHGGGEERIAEYFFRKVVPSLEILASDNRYLMLHALYTAYKEGSRHGIEETANRYRNAFVEGRLKKRKIKAGVKVWILPSVVAAVQS